MQQKSWPDDVWFLRYGAWQMGRWTDRQKKWHTEMGAPPKKPYSIARKNLWGVIHSKPNPPSSPLSTNTKFWSKHTPLFGILNWHSKPPTLGNFGIFLNNVNNEINIVTYSFFFTTANSIYYFHMYNITEWKTNSYLPGQLLWKANVPSMFPL